MTYWNENEPKYPWEVSSAFILRVWLYKSKCPCICVIQRDGLVWTNRLLAPHHKNSSNRTPITPDCSRHNAIKVLVFNFTITCKVICTFVWVPSIPQYNRVPIWLKSFPYYTCSLWKPFNLLSHFTLIKTIISYHIITDITFGCPNSFNTWFEISETIYYSSPPPQYSAITSIHNFIHTYMFIQSHITLFKWWDRWILMQWFSIQWLFGVCSKSNTWIYNRDW